jgi:hypothetical protein
VAKPDEGRWDETIPAGEVSDPCEAPFNGAPSVVELQFAKPCSGGINTKSLMAASCTPEQYMQLFEI